MATDPQRVEQPAEPDRPEWLPDKFGSGEDLARSYSEAEQRILALQDEVNRQRTEFSEALSNLEAIQQQTPPQQPFNPQQDPLIMQYQQAVDNGDAQAMLAIQLELNRQITQQTIQEQMKEFTPRMEQQSNADREMAITMATERVARGYDNWEELAPEIGQFLQERPHWIPEGASVEGFERVLTEAAQIITAGKIVAARDAEEHQRQEKIAAQGLTGTGGRVPTPEENAVEWDRIKQIDLGGYASIMGRQSRG